MTYKLIGLAFVFLISTPFGAFAQKMSPIIVETGKPIPSVVKSGESFAVNYRATYTDAVLIIEDQMQLNSLALLVEDGGQKPKSAVPEVINVQAEVVSLAIGEKIRDGNDGTGYINVQDFTYTFLIINERKGSYKLPSFNFIWARKGAGTTVAEVKDIGELQEFPTKEVGIVYVTSVVRPPTVNVRDGIQFDNFETMAIRANQIAYGTIGLMFLSALVVLFRFYRQPKSQKTDEGNDASETVVEEVTNTATPSISLKKARKRFFQRLNALEKEFASLDENKETRDLAAARLYQLVRPFILAELSEGSVRVFDAQTPKEICKYLIGLSDKQKKQLGRRYGVVLALVLKSDSYYESLESGNCLISPKTEIGQLRSIVQHISLRQKFLNAARNLVYRSLRR